MVVSRPLTLAHLDGCRALVEEAGWNQTDNDWRMILGAGEGIGLFKGDSLLATAAIMPYGSLFGWICMVLVTSGARRQGHATRLIDWSLERLHAMRLRPGLDATPAGRQVYLRLGFADIYSVTRLAADQAAPPPIPASSPSIRRLERQDLETIARFDTPIFGASRAAVIEGLAGRMPALAHGAFAGPACVGFVLGREGRRATQLGPLVAADEGIAQALVARAVQECGGPVFMDVPDRHAGLLAWLGRGGFTPQRSFTRMLAGGHAPIDDPARIFALTGPEFA